MTTLRRYTPEEDRVIIENWWDPERRDQIIKELDRTKASLNFRYYSVLKNLGINPSQHRLQKGVLPEVIVPKQEESVESTIIDKLSEMEEEISLMSEKLEENRKMMELVLTEDRTGQRLAEIYTQYQNQLEANKKMYDELDYWLGQFFKLNNLEKLSTLNDFLPKIQEIVNKGKEEAFIKR